ncbi:unnamed protein product [Cyprideis torosa]|uniref:Uncharacterized protein n=1 Tax=Cyprideis torosa TaxID=163714 RepID=A0A7R8W5R9_9CRUS|nr:unnamed protein product [Cyprideis torosa]CAG0885623.1 unnamed protein product [Cyprideis torosa]
MGLSEPRAPSLGLHDSPHSIRQHEAEESLKQPHPPYFMGQIYHIQPSSTEPPEGLEEVVYPRQPSPSLPGAPPAMPVTHEVPPSYASLFQPIDKGLKAKEID